MRFEPVLLRKGARVDWKAVTHLRLTGRKATTPHANQRRALLAAAADRDGVVELSWALQHLTPVRQLSSREQGIKSDLRNWANSADHGVTDQDKGWLELGYMRKEWVIEPKS